jgi:hypothetical protein
MNSIENFKLTQWRKFSKIFSYICMQSFNIFGAIEGFLFKFTNLSGVWKFENYLTRPGPHVSARFRFTDQDGRPVPRVTPVPSVHAHRAESAQRRWPLVVAAPRGLLPPPYHCSGRHRGSHCPLHFSPSHVRPHSSLLCSAPAAASPTIARHRRAALSCLTRPKGVPHLCAPPAPRAFPQRRLTKPGHGISPPSSSSVSTSPTTAFSDCSPTVTEPPQK